MKKKSIKKLSSFLFLFSSCKGQSLIEILVGILVGSVLLVSASTAVVLITRNTAEVKNAQIVAPLAQELLDNVKVIAESDWNKIYLLSKGESLRYYIDSSRAVVPGEETLNIEGKNFTRYFYVENVNRISCGVGDIIINATTTCLSWPGGNNEISEDPSTQKITAVVKWGGILSLSASEVQYLSRSRNEVFVQTDWSGGVIADEVLTTPNNKFTSSTDVDFASAPGSLTLSAGKTSGNLVSSIFDTQRTNGAAFNSIMWQGQEGDGTVKFQIASNRSLAAEGSIGYIDDTYRYAWNDSVGWIDFVSPGRVYAGENQLTGYAYNPNIGEIALDCATTPNGNICSVSDFKVSRAPNGDLSGWAWNDSIGWISFNCSNTGTCGVNYKVVINNTTGAFSGWAWNDYIGWISFNCEDVNPAYCATMSDYRVNTSLTSSWDYIGWDGTANTYYGPMSPNTPLPINPAFHNNHPYVRYKVFLERPFGTSQSSRIDDIIINWSP